VLAIQIIGKTIRVIDEVVAQYMNHQQMKELCAKREWWPYMHEGTIDPFAGENHALAPISTPADEWRRKDDNFGPVAVVLPQRLKNTNDEISMASTYFTGMEGWTIQISQRCERLRWELATWKRKKVNNVLGEPEKKGNDAIKALIYFLTHHHNGQLALSTRHQWEVSDYNLTGTRIDPFLTMERDAQQASAEREVWESSVNWMGI
jgi:hypothetical protein